MSENMPWDDEGGFHDWWCLNTGQNLIAIKQDWITDDDLDELGELFAKAVQFGREQGKVEINQLKSQLSKSIAREQEMEKEIESLQADKRELVEALDYICGLSNALNAAVNTANASIDKHEEKQ